MPFSGLSVFLTVLVDLAINSVRLGMSRDVSRTQKSNANAMRMRKFFENTMRMRCDARKKNLVRCECDAIFLSHFFAFSQNAKNRIMRKIAKCENAKNAIFARAQPFSKTRCSAMLKMACSILSMLPGERN